MTEPPNAPSSTTRDAVATALIVITCGVILYANWNQFFRPAATSHLAAPPSQPVSIEGASLKGRGTASVVLIEWSDYECPYCARAQRDILPALDEQYFKTGKVQLAFYHHPLSIHPRAEQAAEAAVCAGRQNKFWEMQDALFKDPTRLEATDVIARAREAGVNEKALAECLASDVSPEVRSHVKRAEDLGLPGTPAFLIGRRQPDGKVKVNAVISGSKPLQEFVSRIESALTGGQK